VAVEVGCLFDFFQRTIFIFFVLRFDQLSVEQSTSSSEHVETIKQLTMQNEMLTQTFKVRLTSSVNYIDLVLMTLQEQMKVLQDEHHRSVEMLQRQLDAAEHQVFQLETQLQSAPAIPKVASSASIEEVSNQVVEYVKDPRAVERQSGEGMENTDFDCRKQSLPGNSLVPLEQLLNSPLQDDTASM
jgi:hypothetical protein